VKKRQKAELLFQEKLSSAGRIREIKSWKVTDSVHYPDGVRYRLVFVNIDNGFVHLLYDNHWPKGHHVHIVGVEQAYSFESIGALTDEFEKRSKEIERKLNEDKKDQN
jgi:hypothetical protein